MSSTYELIDDNQIPDDVIIPDNTWALRFDDVTIVINYIQFAPEENEDGTYDLSIDYDVVEGDISKLDNPMQLIGDAVVDILEDAAHLDNKKEEHKELLKLMKDD